MEKGSVEPVIHCSIALSGTTMDFHNWASGGLDSSITGDPVLKNISSVSQSTDPLERDLQISELTLEILDDGKIRSLMNGQVFNQKICTVRLGAANLDLSADFFVMFRGNITKIVPSEGSLSIKLRTLEGVIEDKQSMRTWANQHPFEIVREMLLASGIASADIDTASFTPATYSDDISHYNFCSQISSGVNTHEASKFDNHVGPLPEQIMEKTLIDFTFHIMNWRNFVEETLRLTRSCLFVNTLGKVALNHFNSGAATSAHFTVDDYNDFKQVEEEAVVYNRINIQFHDTWGHRYVKQDNTSIALYGERPIDGGVAYLACRSFYGEGSSEEPRARNYVGGFAGTKDMVLGGVPVEARISSDRPAYWLHRMEVLKSTSPHVLVTDYGDYEYGSSYDDEGERDGRIYTPKSIEMAGVASRPFLGSKSNEAPSESLSRQPIWDLTATFDYSDYVLNRFSNTCPKITIVTSLKYAFLDIGDLVSLDNDVFFSPELGLDGLDSSVKFEICGKEISALGSECAISFDLYYATKTSPPATNGVVLFANKFVRQVPNDIELGILLGLEAGTTAGLECINGSGLEIQIQPGGGFGGAGMSRSNQATQALELVASKDHYVSLNLLNGSPAVTVVDIGDPEPSFGLGEMRLSKVTTNGSAITSNVDLRNFGSVSVGQIDPEAVAPGLNNVWNGEFGAWRDPGTICSGYSSSYGVMGTDFKRGTTTRSGKHSFHCLNTSTNVRVDTRRIPIDKNKAYKVSAWAQQSALFSARIDVYWVKSDNSASSVRASDTVHNANLGSTGAWKELVGYYTPPSDATACYLTIFRSASPGGTLDWSSLSIVEKEPSFRVYSPSVTSLTKADVNHLKFTSSLFDIGSGWTAGTSWYYTVPEDGLYSFTLNFTMSCTWTYHTSYLYCYLTLDDGSATTIAQAIGQPYLASSASCVVSCLELCSAGDKIRAYAYPGADSPTALTGRYLTYFEGTKIR
tara:strand:+ start:7267 stop:10188 length:2922 start_codon:yes stop_codon:yes gene_type:complete